MKIALSANARGVREELIEALADALVADIEQCPVLPMPAPVRVSEGKPTLYAFPHARA